MQLSFSTLPKYSYAGFAAYKPHTHHISRTCSQDVLVMVYDGVLCFEENGVPVDVHAGEYYIQRRNTPQTGNRESQSPKYYYIHFVGEFSETADGIPLRGKADFTKLLPLFRALDAVRFSSGTLLEKSAVVYQILGELRQGANSDTYSRVVAQVIVRASRTTGEPFSLAQTAKALGYSKNQIINIFKKQTGKTPYAYVTGMRLDRAKRMLESSDASLAEIGESCGFGSYVNLYKAFVKAENCAPLVWRQKRLENIAKSTEKMHEIL